MKETTQGFEQSTDRSEAEHIREVYEAYRRKGWGEKKWSTQNPGNRAILSERQRKVRVLLSEGGLIPLSARKILEVGCGSGGVMLELLGMGASPDNCHGLDLIPQRIAQAQQTCPSVHFRVGNAQDLPYRDTYFDLVLAFTVFSSIRNEQTARSIALEIDRVLRPGATVLWYDLRFNNPGNPNVRGISTTTMRSLFPGYVSNCRTVTLLPPLARRLGRFTPALYLVLTAVPLLRTHIIATLTKGH